MQTDLQFVKKIFKYLLLKKYPFESFMPIQFFGKKIQELYYITNSDKLIEKVFS